jgi:hypothetical protein
VRRGTVEGVIILLSEYHPFAGGQSTEALVPRRRREPGTYPVRVSDPVDVLDQPHPRRLEDISRVAFDELEIPGDRPDEPTVSLDEAFPCPGITAGRPAH